MTKTEILLAHKEHLFPAVFHYYKEPLLISHAKDQYVWDHDGKQYLDFFAGILTVSVGHSNSFVNERLHAQLDRLIHVSTLYATEPQVALAKKIAEISPAGALRKCFFTNSGTEANETAILAARCYTGSSEIVALRFSYHGRTAQAMGLTGQSNWRLPGAPQAGVVFAHNAYCYRCPFGLKYPECELRCAKNLEETIQTTTSGRIAALIAEPIQGAGGFITPPREYFRIVADIVRQYGGIFISDEVQTGWGRTGDKWFGIEHYGVEPDVITSAKGLANGLPIGLTAAKPEIADSVVGITLSTFGGNPLSTTAAKAVLDFIEQQDLRKNAAEVGQYLRSRLEELAEKYPLIGDVRGMGLMQGVELVRDRQTKQPAGSETNLVLEAARQEGLLIGKGGLWGNLLRIAPPLNISKSDVDEFARLLDRALAQVTKQAAVLA
ncbi:MAG: aspartate aminotransferase family protein [Bryobacteraceae bacterium]|nr:aspartate aminotransferase family protein [Bryobacteraceae bacterium]MDW8376825.1 aspartate aminotransferase family protein [Bryobacterales bacterium]